MLSPVTDRLRGSWRILLKEVTAFGAVGLVGLVIQLGLFNLLHPIGALKANAIAMVCATAFAYVGNRYLSFSHRARTGLGREAGWFFGINAVTFVLAEFVLAIAYVFDAQNDKVVTNVLNLIGIGLGTIIRFWAYKQFVFVNPNRVNVITGEIGPADAAIVDDPAA